MGSLGSTPGTADSNGEGNRLLQRLMELDDVKDGCGLCFHFSRSELFQRRPDLLGLARRSFLKQTASVDFDRYVLVGGDLVIIGATDVPNRIDTAVARLCDLVNGEDPEPEAPSFISYFNLATDDGVAELMEIATAGHPGQCAGTTRTAPAAKRPLSPQDVAMVCARMAQAGVADLIKTQTAISLGGAFNKLLYREAYVDIPDLQRKFAAEIDFFGRPLFRFLMEALDRCVLRHLPQLANASTGVPLSINLALNTLSSPEFATFRSCCEPAAPLFVEIHIVDVLSAPAAFETVRRRLAESGVVLVVDGVPLCALDHFDLTSLRPVQVKVMWDQRRDGGALPERGRALRRAVAQIGRENVVLARVDSEHAIACALGAGITRVQGRLVERLLTKAGSA